MKIRKFNEEIEHSKEYHICVITYGGIVDEMGIFETQEDMDNWILNKVNERVLDNPGFAIEENDMMKNDEDQFVFVNVTKAINWFNDDNSQIDYGTGVILKNVEAKYGVELLKQTSKYNL